MGKSKKNSGRLALHKQVFVAIMIASIIICVIIRIHYLCINITQQKQLVIKDLGNRPTSKVSQIYQDYNNDRIININNITGMKSETVFSNLKQSNSMKSTLNSHLVYASIFTIIVALIIYLCFFAYHKACIVKKLKEVVDTDLLTGARNINKFKIDANMLFEKNNRNDYVIVYMDIDRFKYINDTFGYEAGDNILCHVAKCLDDMLRADEIFARLSADNFIILINNTGEMEILERIRNLNLNIQANYKMQESSHKLVISFGICKLENSHSDLTANLDKANTARKSVKGCHTSTYAFYDNQMHQQITDEIEIVESMQAALNNKEFEVYLQPKCQIKTNKILGAEALIRWIHPQKGIISPNKFIPIFEKNGFITKVDFFVFEEVCKTLSYMREHGYEIYPISVNLSRVHMQSTDFIDKLIDIANKYDVPSELLELELTETVILHNIDDLLSIMTTLKEKGFLLSMDDFGTGYSSLNLLKELPFDILKIDRGFFNDVHATQREKIVIKDVVAMAHHLDMKVVSEGVETQRQKKLLQEINCDMAQGYLYAKPMPIKEYLEFVKNK